jgi:UDP-N-acetylmuramoylalanine--D-glutamate ligase
MTFETLARQGQTTEYQSLAASVGPRIREIRKSFVQESFSGFLQAEHRMETVAVIRDMEFINDSRSSSLNAAWYALESVNRPVIWIAGGIDPGNDYTILRHLVRSKVRGIICLGIDNTRLLHAFGDLNLPMTETISMEEAVQTAYYMGENGYAVLLSPACPSFDLFRNYEERGKAFRLAVKNL